MRAKCLGAPGATTIQHDPKQTPTFIPMPTCSSFTGQTETREGIYETAAKANPGQEMTRVHCCLFSASRPQRPVLHVTHEAAFMVWDHQTPPRARLLCQQQEDISATPIGEPEEKHKTCLIIKRCYTAGMALTRAGQKVPSNRRLNPPMLFEARSSTRPTARCSRTARQTLSPSSSRSSSRHECARPLR